VQRDSFEIVAGARRYRASLLAEQFSIPSRIVELTDPQSLEWALVELSIDVKNILCNHATRHDVYM
jgi:ParB-like chromosome segregation protein Spo0J